MSYLRLAEMMAFAGSGIAISIVDIRSLRIPDCLSFSSFALIITLSIAIGSEGPSGRLEGLVFNVAFYALCRFVTRGGLGMGDIKLSAVTGLFVGFPGVMAAGLAASLSALPFALAKGVTDRGRVAFAPFLLVASFAVRATSEMNLEGLLP